MKSERMQLVLALCLVLVSSSGCTLEFIAAQQVQATGLWDELVGGETFGQSFVSARDNLYRIDLSMATYARTNSSPVIFHLRNSPESTIDITTIYLPGPEIQNDRSTSFVFPALPDSKGKSYYFFIESPEATSSDAITVYINGRDQYPDGKAYRNGQTVSADLAFTAYSHDSFNLFGLWRDLRSRIAQDVPFFYCYGILVLGVCVTVLASLSKYHRGGDL